MFFTVLVCVCVCKCDWPFAAVNGRNLAPLSSHDKPLFVGRGIILPGLRWCEMDFVLIRLVCEWALNACRFPKRELGMIS